MELHVPRAGMRWAGIRAVRQRRYQSCAMKAGIGRVPVAPAERRDGCKAERQLRHRTALTHSLPLPPLVACAPPGPGGAGAAERR